MSMKNEESLEETQVVLSAGIQGNPEETTEEEPDYKVLLEKTTNDLKALRAQRGKRDDMNQMLRSIQEHQRVISEELQVSKLTNQALIKALADGTTEELPARVTQITTAAEKARMEKESTSQAERLYEGFLAINKDGEGNLIIDQKSPEYIEAYNVLSEGFRLGSFPGIQDGYNLLYAAQLKKLRGEVQNEHRNKRKALDDATDLDIGPRVGGSLGKAAYATMLKKGQKLPPKEEIDRITSAYLRRVRS